MVRPHRGGQELLSQTLVGSQFSPTRYRLQPCTADEWKTGHFWATTGTMATSFMAVSSASCQYFVAAAVDGADKACCTARFTTGLL